MQSSSRNKAKVRLLAVHTTEGIMSAFALKDFFNRPTAAGSSHASADQDGVLLSGAKDGYVDYALAAWTLRNGNPISDNIELCGFAKWKRGDWLAKPKMLDACARWLAERSVARGIPLVKLSPKEVAAGKSGVIGHTDWTVGMSDGTHWDPGPDFPYDVVLDKAAAYASGKDKNPGSTVSEEDEPMIVNVEPGHYEVVPLPTIPDGKKLFARFAVDEENGGSNVRIAVGWGQGKWYALPDFDKDDGYTGWLFNGAPYEVELAAPASVLSVRHLGSRASLGVLLELR